MAKTLKAKKKWDKPNTAIEHSDIQLIKANISEIVCNSALLHDKLIDSLLVPCLSLSLQQWIFQSVPELASAYANLVTDLVLNNNGPILRKNIHSVLKGLQRGHRKTVSKGLQLETFHLIQQFLKSMT